MSRKYTDITFTDSVKDAQTHYGSRAMAQGVEDWETDDEHLSPAEQEFLSERDGFYMATVNEQGWPYVQFRGGPKGFLKVLDARTLGYADFRGNRQYISTGNLRASDRVALFFMDYATRRRLKVMAHARVVDAEERPDLLDQVRLDGYRARVERVVVFDAVAFDWNCPQHITPRYTLDELVEHGIVAAKDEPAGDV